MGVRRIQVISEGFPGGPGFTNFYFKTVLGPSVADQGDAIKDWLDLVKAGFPSQWSAQIQTEVQVFDEETGELTGYESLGSAMSTPIPGTTGTEFGSGLSGACVSWVSSEINRGRRIRGRTFLVPLSRYHYDANGTLNDSWRGQLVTYSQALISGGTGFGIWSRPVAKAGGKISSSLTANVSDKVAYLSSRRS